MIRIVSLARTRQARLAISFWATALLLLHGGMCMGSERANGHSLALPSIFSEQMVLQRGGPVPIWGRGAPGQSVRVRVYDRDRVLAEETATVREAGDWRVDLSALPTGGRYTLLVEALGADGKRVTDRVMFTDVLVGEVWLTCGQSNMIWPLDQASGRDEAVATREEYPQVRVAQVTRRDAHEVTEAQWQPQSFWGPVRWESSAYRVPRSSRTDVPGSISAVSHFFARQLYDHLERGVPVGMIDVGAILPVEAWVPPASLDATPELHHLSGKGYPHATTRAFLSNIAPIAPYALRGVIYYQGEMNGSRSTDYRFGLEAMIRGWRNVWSQPSLPFLLVQLPSFIEHRQQQTHALDMDAASLAEFEGNTSDHGFVRIREAQRRVAEMLPQVGLAVTLDLGEPFDIHPPRKRPVAERLFLEAKRLVYTPEASVPASPRAAEITMDAGGAIIRFTHAGAGLVLRKGEADTGFEIQGKDGAWVPGSARVVGADRVRVEAPNGLEPTGVRYAWRGFPPVTLYNEAGLPAAPFHAPAVSFSPEP